MEEIDREEEDEIELDDVSEDESCHFNEIIENPKFTDKLYKEISKVGNVLISPLNVEILLGMIYQGAVGETAKEIATALDLTNKKEAAEKYKREIEKLSGLTSLNQIFIKTDFLVKNTFETVLEDSFKSKVEGVDFSDTKKACNEINQWVEDKTKNKIKDLVSPGSLDDTMGLVLVSAVYFKSTWEIPFLEIDTTIQPFFISENKAVDCEMMFTSGYYKYSTYHKKLCTEILEIPFKGEKLSMIIIMDEKDESDINEVEQMLEKVELCNIMEEKTETKRVELFFPKFKIEVTHDLKPLLEKMELDIILQEDIADFSEITENSETLYVSKFIQKACLEICEDEPNTTILPESKEVLKKSVSSFVVDHPFMYVLQAKGEENNSVLFAGKVLNPLC